MFMGPKNFICLPIFKIYAGPIRTNYDQDFDMKIIFLSSLIEKFSAKNQYQIIVDTKCINA